MLRIIIGSDVFPTPKDRLFFEEGRLEKLLPHDHIKKWQSADFSIINIECPLTKSKTNIKKMGPSLKASPLCVNFFRALGLKLASLANNHILDYGGRGISDTVTAFRDAGIATIGAGANLTKARIPFIHKFPDGRKIGVMAMTENEFSIAGWNSPGANPIDFTNYTILARLKKEAQKILVILHAGNEMLTFPRPGLIDLCHFLVDQGADAVIVQHTHCIGGVEIYNSAPIVYGQGNFIFNQRFHGLIPGDEWWQGMIVELAWPDSSDNWTLNLFPFMQIKEHVGIRNLTMFEEEQFLNRQVSFEKLISDRRAIEYAWLSFCKRSSKFALLNIMGAGRLVKGLAARGIPVIEAWKRIVNTRVIQNMARCESHRELLVTVLKNIHRNSG